MIKLFNPEDTDFSTNGEIVLKAMKSRVFNSDNGEFYLEMTCGAEYSDYVNPECILVVPTPRGEQAFRISELDKTARKIEAKAMHLSYDTQNYIVPSASADDCQTFLELCNTNTDILSPFQFYSDISDTIDIFVSNKSLSECLTIAQETFGGHIVRDNYKISLLSTIGEDYGETIEYRKNLEELTASYNYNEVCTKLLPIGKDGLTLPELYVEGDLYSTPHTKVVEFSQDIEKAENETEIEYNNRLVEDLRLKAYDYLRNHKFPYVNYTIKGILLSPADIGDIIQVKDKRLGVNILTSVTSYEYDSIRKKYISLEFGNVQKSLSDLLTTINKSTQTSVNNAITNQNNYITNQLTEIENNTSELNSKITEVESTTNSINDNVTIAQADISALQNSIATAQSDITQLQSDMSSAQSDITDLYDNKSNKLLEGNNIVLETEASARRIWVNAKTKLKRISMSTEFNNLGPERRAELCHVFDDYNYKTIQYKRAWDVILKDENEGPPTTSEGTRGQICFYTSNSSPFHIINIYIKLDENTEWWPLYTS